LRSFDISFVDPTIHTYVLAVSATAGAGTGSSSNPRIIVVDTTTNKVTNEYNAKPTFTGACSPPGGRDDFSGPNGVILIEGTIKGKKVDGDIWAADGPVYSPSCAFPGNPSGTPGVLTKPSSIRVLDLKTGKTKATLSTGGQARADELCFNPAANVVLVANDDPLDNFITFWDEDSYAFLGKITFVNFTLPGSGGTITANGIEQCAYDPRDGQFYLNIPMTNGKGPGYTLRISPVTFSVTAALQIPTSTGCAGPQGLAVGPSTQLGLGCGGTNSLIVSDTFPSGATSTAAGSLLIATVTGQGGTDEAWFNPGTNHYYFARSTPAALGVEDGVPPSGDGAISTASGSHSVAADSVTNQVYVPIRSNLVPVTSPAVLPTVCSSFSGNTADDVTGCIAVYNDVGEVPPGAP
jgi:hypothetical protein